MSDIDADKLKVSELRDELKARGLDTKGNKAALVSRLKDAMGTTGGGEYIAREGGEDEDDEEEEEEELMEEAGEEEAISYHEDADEGATNGEGQEEQGGGEEKAEHEGGEGENADANGNEEEFPVLGDEFHTIDEAPQDDTAEGNTDRKRRRSHSKDHRRRSRSRSRNRHDRRYARFSPPPRKIEMDDASWESLTVFNLDRYDSDLNLRFNDRGIKAHPLTVDGFAFMWSGVRAMYGVRAGKVAYEVKILENLKVEHLPKEESNPHVLRVGWSVNSTSLNLGEEPLSYGYGGTGKASTECKFVDYGQTFTQGDVITAYLDLESDPVIISYSKNGEDLGKCFEIEKEHLGDNALFPHLMTKNTEFEVNFGGREGPYFALKEGFKFLEEVPTEERVRGHVPPATKEACEVIMMVGLPGAGKTYWVNKHAAENPEKLYNVLGTNNIIDKMKVMGLPRKLNYNGRWDVLIDKATKCLNRMIEIAAHKKRNYIIDQTNVYASARRRKMQPFEGFQRKAVVVLPTDEVFKNRVKERTDEEGKDIPESAVNEMKANFTLPKEGEYYDAVEYTETEVTKEEREKLIEMYRKEGRDALPPPEKRYRRESRDYRVDRRGGGYYGGYDREYRGGFRSRSRSRSRIRIRGRSRGRRFSSWRPYSERRARSSRFRGSSYRGSYRDDRYRDDRRDRYGSYKRGRGSYGGWDDDWGSQSKWSSSYDQGWDDYNEGYDDGWDGYEDDVWGSYGYR